jgi:parvulin-like peptidyl-prolyl isomerase
VDVVRQEVADQIVARALRLQEARRLGLKADNSAIQATLDSYDERYRNSPRWQAQRTEMLAVLGQRLEEEDLLRQLEKRIRDVEVPDRLQLEQYYKAYPEKFTEPAQQKVSVILLGVDPSSSTEVWDAAMTEAAGLVSELRAGADFAELARLRSADRSAQAGGDMGYLHAGMLSPAAQEVVDALDIGVVSDPVRLLKGIAIFRVSERRQARLRAYSDVEQRVRALSTRQRSDEAWEAFNRRLASTTPVHIYPESGSSVGE